MNLRNSTLLVSLVLSLSTLSRAANSAGADGVREKVKAQALVNYGKLPLSFEENRGQADARVKFRSHGSDYSILLTPSEVLLNLRTAGKARHQSAIRMSFPGAKSSPVIAGGERQTATSSYFIGDDPAKWVTGAPNFARVCYAELYPGVDLSFYGNQGQLEYDFVVAPGASPRAIRLQFDGVDGMHLDRDGNLILTTSNGEIQQQKPIVYQEGAGGRQIVAGRYVIQPRNRVAFEIARYDHRKQLVIDPSVIFATYLGSKGEEVFGISAAASTATYPAVAVDPQGNVYVTGYMGGNIDNFPGPPKILPAGVGGTDIFVVKMNPTGTALLYSVVFGTGSDEDIPGGIAVDSGGNAYITGHTNSAQFPVTANAPQPSLPSGAINAFATKVNAAGTALVYSTYLGGSGIFYGNAIAVDHSGNAYVTGTATQSLASGYTLFPLVNPILSTPSAGFLTEVNTGGTAFTYSTFLAAGIGYGVAVDSNGDAYVTGSTGSAGAPSPAQGYVLKVNAGGAGVAYAVPLGNTGAALQTIGFGIALDAQDNAYVAGMTNDPGFPQIQSAAQSKFGGGFTDGFAVKLDSSGVLQYGTYIGGLGSNLLPERASGIGVDAEGNAYVSGTTQCIGFPTVSPVSGARNGTASVLMKGTISGATSNWSSTGLAGSFDQVTALAFDPSGNLYAGTSALNATGGGVYKLASGGSTWAPANSGITSTTIDSIAVDPNTPSTVYAAGSGHLYQSVNGGASWTPLAQAVGTSAVIAIAKTSPSTVYVGSSAGLIYSTSPATKWGSPTPLPGGAINAIVADPNNLTTAYAGTSTGVYQTVDGGAVWSAVNTGLEPTTGPLVAVNGLAINGSTKTIYAATGSGLFYTTNAGGAWTQVMLGTPEPILNTPSLVAVDAGNNVYLAFAGADVATGTSGGTQPSDWSMLTSSGLTQNPILALAAPPTGSGTAYAGVISATTAFLTEISPSGQSFLSSTCIGGSDNNLGQSVAVTPGGAALVAGLTYATNFPATPGAVQTANAGLYDAFVMGIGAPTAQISSPVPGFELSDTSDTFLWNSASGATAYQLTIGTTPGGSNIYSATLTGTSQTVDFIPCTGGTIYVQLAVELNGVFQAATTYSFKCKSAIGDYNGSGSQDLLWQNTSTGQVNVNYFGGVGPQPQGSAVLNNGSTLAGWRVVGAGDFDQNGAQDLVLQNTASGQVDVNYYAAGGTTVIGSAVLSPGMAGWSVVAVADQNGDGFPDLIWQNSGTGEVIVDYYGGNGGATMTGSAVLNSGAATAGWRVVADADFDQNGTPDLVWQNQSTGQVNVNYYGGSGGATFIGYAVLNSGGAATAGWSVVGAADWNADGVPDLIWQNNTTLQVNVNYYGGGGGAKFEGWNCLDCGSNFVGSTVRAVAPFGASGEQSLVWQNASTNAVNVYYYGLGGYLFQGWNLLNSGADTSGWRVVGAADFDGNGVPDLVWENTSTGQVNVDYYGGAGGATLIGYAVLNSGAGTAGWTIVAVADMNGDGVPDLIWEDTSTGQVNVNYYSGAGGATRIGYAVLNGGGPSTTGWHVVAAADFDGNGVPDLVWQNTSTRQVNVDYYGGATGTTLIGYAVLNTGVAGWTVAGANDFDGNGVPDLVWRNDSTGQVNVDYYGGPRGAVLKGFNVLNSGAPGWSVIVPRER